MENLRVNIRPYEEGDHDRVCRLFSNGIGEYVIPAYTGLITSHRHLYQQVFLLSLVYFLTSSIFWIFYTEIILQISLLGIMKFIFWQIVHEGLNSDMKDKSLSHWTGPGEDISGFFVAEVEGEVVGSVAYIRVNDNTWELFRISVDVKLRQRKIAQKLVEKVEEVGATLGVMTLKADTGSFRNAANKFYPRSGWVEVIRYKYPGYLHFLHGIQVITFHKEIHKEAGSCQGALK